jgi:hypothetical protein
MSTTVMTPATAGMQATLETTAKAELKESQWQQ